MTQERRTQFTPPQVVDSELLQARQNILKRVDPFQEGPEGERLRAIGLSNLYAQMADPSVEFLEAVTSGLASLPFDN